MPHDELADHLESLQRDDCYRVDSVLKESEFETTQRVYFMGINGAEQGPYIRKYLKSDYGLGGAYASIFEAQKHGRRFSHLPRIYDCFKLGETMAVIMEFIPGETLQDVVYRCDPSPDLADDVFPRVCDAVIELHEGFSSPIIHRDLKPSNIMLSQDNLTIIDFGIARDYRNGAFQDTNKFGTRGYAPPEQFGFGQTDERSDVYALGLILYYCLTEKTPDGEVKESGFGMAAIPPAYRQILITATSFDPADRYPSVRELKRAFLQAQASRQSMPAPTGAPVYTQPFATPYVPGTQSDVRPADMQPPRSFEAVETRSDAADHRGKRSTYANALSALLDRIPLPLGIVWDVVLAVLFVFFVVVGITVIINPPPGSEQAVYSLGARAIQYGAVIFLVIGPALYLLTDIRPLKRLVPPLRRFTFEAKLIGCIVAFAIGFIVVGLSGYLR